MNKGMPNTSAIGAKALLIALGVTGFWAGPLAWLIGLFMVKGSKKILAVADETHVAIIMRKDGDDFDEETDKAYAIVDSGVQLSQEEKDAIDKPVMDAFIRVAKFRVRNPKQDS